MNVETTALPGVVVITPDVFRDARGFFLESWSREKYTAAGIGADFVQDNHSRSARGVLRGLHLQWRRPQAKLVRALAGSVFDMVVDVRRHSPTFGVSVGVELSADNFRQIFVPAGYAHGFCVTSDEAQIEYKVDAPWDPQGELTVLWNDAVLGLAWPVEAPILSPKDAAGLTVDQAQPLLRAL